MPLAQLHRLKTRTCPTRTKLMRKTRRSAPLNQQRRNRSSEQRKFAGGRRERLADVFMEYKFLYQTQRFHTWSSWSTRHWMMLWCEASWDADAPPPKNVFSRHLITNLLQAVLGKWTQGVFVCSKWDVADTCSPLSRFSWSILKQCEFSTWMQSKICFFGLLISLITSMKGLLINYTLFKICPELESSPLVQPISFCSLFKQNNQFSV